MVPKRLQEQLLPGERLLWHGGPSQSMRMSEIPLWIVSCLGGLLFGGLGVGLLWLCVKNWRFDLLNISCLLLGIPFVLVGFNILFYPLIAHFKRPRIFYGLTDKRVIIAEPWPWPYVISMDLGRITGMRVIDERRDGTGNIQFTYSGWTRSNSRSGEDTEFDSVKNAHGVQDCILRAQKEAGF